MVKFLPLVIILILVLAGLAYFRWFRFPETTETPAASVSQTFFPNQATPSTTDTSLRLTNLESAVIELAKKIATVNTLENKVKTDESNITDLQNRVARLERGGTTPITLAPTIATSTKKSPEYIPLGGSITNNDQNWSKDNICCQVSLDPADYPGYSSFQLEATVRLNEKSGEAHVRFYNVTDGVEVGNTDIYTTSDQYALITSSGFKLVSGKKTYGVQMRSTNSMTEYLQTARLKVNF